MGKIQPISFYMTWFSSFWSAYQTYRFLYQHYCSLPQVSVIQINSVCLTTFLMTRNIVLYGHYQQTLFCCPSLEMLEGQLFFAGAITIVGVKYLCFRSPKLKYTVRYSDTFCQSAVCLFTCRSFCKISILIISTHLSYWYFFFTLFH